MLIWKMMKYREPTARREDVPSVEEGGLELILGPQQPHPNDGSQRLCARGAVKYLWDVFHTCIPRLPCLECTVLHPWVRNCLPAVDQFAPARRTVAVDGATRSQLCPQYVAYIIPSTSFYRRNLRPLSSLSPSFILLLCLLLYFSSISLPYLAALVGHQFPHYDLLRLAIFVIHYCSLWSISASSADPFL